MPTARRSRMIAAPAQELWELVSDPHHLPRWWPRVSRVEDVDGDEFTEVMLTKKGKTVRADFNVARRDELERTIVWEQRLQGTPFARLLKSAETELRLRPDGATTEVTVELRQSLAGVFPHFGGYMVRRAAAATIEQALDGLQRING